MNSRAIILILSFFCALLFAKEKTFVREYTYKASDYDSKVTSRVNALEQVKQLLLVMGLTQRILTMCLVLPRIWELVLNLIPDGQQQ